MKHLFEIADEPWFREKDWLLLGTGPSLDDFDYQKHTDKNIAAIYCAGDVCEKLDLLFVSDQIYFQEYALPANKRNLISADHDPARARYTATRAVNIRYALSNTVFWEYDCDIKGHGDGQGVRHFKEEWVLPCSCTASLTMIFFGLMGVKKVYTCGIDGGVGVSHRMSHGYIKMNQVDPADFDNENSGLFHFAKKFEIELIKL